MDELDLIAEAAPAGFEKLYEKLEDGPNAGKFKLRVKGLPDFEGVAAALANERKQRRELAKELGEFKVHNLSADQLQELIDKKAEYETAQSLLGKKEEEKLAAMTEKMRSDFTRREEGLKQQIVGLETERDGSRKELKGYKIKTEIASIAGKLKVLPEYHDDMQRHANVFDVIEDKIVVVDENGEPRRSGKSAVDPLGPEEYFSDVVGKKPAWLGTSSGPGGGGGKRTLPARTIAAEDKAAFSANIEDIAKGKIQAEL